MKFSIGDRVLFKNDIIKGKIMEIHSDYKAIVRSSDGFEISVALKDLVRIEEDTDKVTSYGNDFYSKDEAEKKFIQSSKKQKSLSVLRVDLHIELLTSNYHSMHNSEIVQIQLNECYNMIDKALNSGIAKLEIIHGIGYGVLKKEVHAILKRYNLRFYLTRDGGATEVYL
jgi:dsDNA-specific endonuclease/ATPase MutS2